MLTAIEDFLQYLKLELGLSSNTISAYRTDLLELARALKKKSPGNITPSNINDYFAKLAAKGRKPATLARKLSAIRRFFEYLKDTVDSKDMAVVHDNPVGGYRTPRIARYHPHYLSVKNIELIIKVSSASGKQAARNRVVIELLYGCGLRISELLNLKVGNIEFEAGFVRVIGKGNKQRLVPLGRFAREAVEVYLDSPERKKYPLNSPTTMLLNRSGKSFSRVGLWKVVKKLVELAGITKTVTPHTFRHSFATHLLAGGADLRTVQEMLGHADISTTEIYTHIDQGYIVAEHRRHHPRELAGFRRK